MKFRGIAGVAAAGLILLVVFSGSAMAYLETGEADGSLDLKVGREGVADRLNIAGIFPGASGTGAYHLENTGRLAGILDVYLPAVANIPGGSGEFADGRGDLGEALEVALFLDADGDGEWSEGDTGLRADGSVYPYSPFLSYGAFNNYSGVRWTDILVMAPARQASLILAWRVPRETGNEILGDAVRFDLIFNLRQAP